MCLSYFYHEIDCWQQCDLHHERTSDSWWYRSNKNKQKIRNTREKVKQLKATGKFKKPPRVTAFKQTNNTDTTNSRQSDDATII